MCIRDRILHRSGFLQTTPDRLREKKAIRLEKWATLEGSIDNSGLSEQVLILTTEMRHRLRLVNPAVYSHRLKMDRKRYPLVVPPGRTLRAERWIDKVGNIGAVPAGKWQPKSDETIEVNIDKVTEADIQDAQRLDAIRRRPRWFVEFEHSSLEDYAKQLDFFKIELGAKLEDGRLLYLSCLLYTSPSPRDATLSRMPSSA